jgi:hypothetical protein
VVKFGAKNDSFELAVLDHVPILLLPIMSISDVSHYSKFYAAYEIWAFHNASYHQGAGLSDSARYSFSLY